MKYLFALVFTLVTQSACSQTPSAGINLRNRWQVYGGTSYEKYNSQKSQVNCVHIIISSTEGSKERFLVSYPKTIAIFLNNQFIEERQGGINYSLDSLRRLTQQGSLDISLYADHLDEGKLFTHLISDNKGAKADVLQERPSTSLRDFIIVVFIFLISFLIVIIQLNPKLASDYFSVIKIISMRESEDSQVYTRITSSGNFLFYGFSSLTIGFFLVLLKAAQANELNDPDVVTFTGYIQQWLLFAMLIVGIFIIKLLIVYLFSSLFRLTEVAGFQFFNWIRLLFLVIGFTVACVVICIIGRITTPDSFQFLAYLSTGLLVGWMILAFFKVASKANLGAFHLFSYLCATEIMPSLVLIKILYY